MLQRELSLTKSDGKDIDFVCEAHGKAVTWEEVQQWFFWLVGNYPADQVPLYAHEIILCDSQQDYARQKNELFGFMTGLDATDAELIALYGIGYLRAIPTVITPNRGIYVPSRDEALAALARNPHIDARFRELFPFLQVDGNP